MDKELLLQLLAEDVTGLLDSKPQAKSATPDDRLLISFKEINAFVSQQGREPVEGGSLQEETLAFRLQGIRSNFQKVEALKPYDEHALLQIEDSSIEDNSSQFTSDYNDDTDDIFTLKHVPSSKSLNMPDYIARRKPCSNFDQYEPLFKQCHADLKARKRTLTLFEKEQSIDQGDFYILKGVMVYVAIKGKIEEKNGKKNARLLCVFENGTESNLLMRSLSRELYRNGRRISPDIDKSIEHLRGITEEDKEAGHIYVLKSLSDDPSVQSISNLYKIGFSTTSVEERIKNAFQEVTYLLAPVSVVSSYKCYNMNPQTFESLIHKFFGNVRLDVDIHDAQGRRHMPREWFSVPLEVIDQAVSMMINGDITQYRYNHLNETIEPLES
jgi:hypothetical protein